MREANGQKSKFLVLRNCISRGQAMIRTARWRPADDGRYGAQDDACVANGGRFIVQQHIACLDNRRTEAIVTEAHGEGALRDIIVTIRKENNVRSNREPIVTVDRSHLIGSYGQCAKRNDHCRIAANPRRRRFNVRHDC